MESKYFVGVDIGGTNVRVYMADKNRFIDFDSQLTVKEGDCEALPRQILEMISNLCLKHQIANNSLIAVGISTTSPFKVVHKLIHVVSPNLCGNIGGKSNGLPNDWESIPLEEVLRRKYDVVKIGNDCTTGAWAEFLFGAGRGYHNIVYVTWSTGIGTGIINNGELILGKNNNAGHCGHIFISDEHLQCGCGNIGDLEAICSGTAIQKTKFRDAVQLFAAFDVGNVEAQNIVYKIAKYFGRGLGSICNFTDTEIFIIGGSIFTNNEVLLPLVKAEFVKTNPSVIVEGVQIVKSQLEGCLGALAALSLVLPKRIIKTWEITRPWEKM